MLENKEMQAKVRKLGTLLQNHRKRLQLSQEEVAFKSGLTRQMVSKIEVGESAPTITTLMKYMKAINLDLLEILNESCNRI